MVKKDIKINIKNTQLAKAIKLDDLKDKLASKKATLQKEIEKPIKKKKKTPSEDTTKNVIEEPEELQVEEKPRIKARSKSAFGIPKEVSEEEKEESKAEEEVVENLIPETEPESETAGKVVAPTDQEVEESFFQEEIEKKEHISLEEQKADSSKTETPEALEIENKKTTEKERLGPTGKHISDLIHKYKEKDKEKISKETKPETEKPKGPLPKKEKEPQQYEQEEAARQKKGKGLKFKEYQDIKPAYKAQKRSLDLTEGDEERRWRKKRKPQLKQQEDLTIRPTALKLRIPISVKDLAAEMKIKASELISKLFLQGILATLNDQLEDETTIQLLGHEFGCEISIDTSEAERLRITDKTIQDEIKSADTSELLIRAPVVTFMGHVDHGKTSLIDTIRKSDIAEGEAGAITQHIGAFKCSTQHGDIAILDTPGHEAFSAMRARGANVTDIVVLVIAGDEGVRTQTHEAIDHAKAAGVTIIVALNKSDKPNFNAENVYRQLADHGLLPETWGGQTITVNCSAKTGEGVKELLEMLALQAEVLELKANPKTRARGTILESEMHKGLGSLATILIQNGTLRQGDALVFGEHWGRVKTMRDEFGKTLLEAGPSTPIEITGLSGLPEAGDEFIVVKDEREAREIAEARQQEQRSKSLIAKKPMSLESLVQQAQDSEKKILNIIIRADVQGSAEALKTALEKIESEKVDVHVISTGVGEVTESDVLLAAASKALIVGFQTKIESHAESLIKQHGVRFCLHDIIYHAIDDVKNVMSGLLDKIAEEIDRGKALVKATFKSSHYGLIAGCLVTEGSIHRNHHIRVMRNGEQIWKGPIASLKRVKEDVREVQKGLECGILLQNFNNVQEGDVLETYEVMYRKQEL